MKSTKLHLILKNTVEGHNSLVVAPSLSMSKSAYQEIERKIDNMIENGSLPEAAKSKFKFNLQEHSIEYLPTGGRILFIDVMGWDDEEKLMGLRFDFTYLLNPSVIDYLKQHSLVDHLYT